MAISNKQEYNKRHNQKKDQPNSKKDISKLSKISMSVLDKVYDRGIGAYKTNPSSVRPTVTSKEQWAMARVYSFINKLESKKKLNHDADLVPKKFLS
tara:strand:- start:131 stop:421 length:291 start_codon:yes stop_codon:yes gene_type:complete